MSRSALRFTPGNMARASIPNSPSAKSLSKFVNPRFLQSPSSKEILTEFWKGGRLGTFSFLLYRDLRHLLSYLPVCLSGHMGVNRRRLVWGQNGAFWFKTRRCVFVEFSSQKIRKLANLGGGVSYSYYWVNATWGSLPQSPGSYQRLGQIHVGSIRESYGRGG